jgi:spectinomycin phosphotransferase
MLEKPAVQDAQIITHLEDAYGLGITQVDFLPLGADSYAAVYRASTADGTNYFLKLKWGNFSDITVTIPNYLRSQGLSSFMAPIATKSGRLWTALDDFKMILYPFIEGHTGAAGLTDAQWRALGATLRGVHTAELPAGLKSQIPHEVYPPRWIESVRMFLERAEEYVTDDPATVAMAAVLKDKREEIERVVNRSEQLGRQLQERDRSTEFVLCHTDIHTANVMVGPDGNIYVVDWDQPILALKERDLMFIGAGIIGPPQPNEEEMFYQGYGRAEIDPVALVYYRYVRIVEDIALFCEQVLLTAEGGEDRAQAVRWLNGQFLPGEVIEIAHQSYERYFGRKAF